MATDTDCTVGRDTSQCKGSHSPKDLTEDSPWRLTLNKLQVRPQKVKQMNLRLYRRSFSMPGRSNIAKRPPACPRALLHPPSSFYLRDEVSREGEGTAVLCEREAKFCPAGLSGSWDNACVGEWVRTRKRM